MFVNRRPRVKPVFKAPNIPSDMNLAPAGQVKLRWYLPSAGRSEIRIHDLNGRSVFQQSSDGGAGWRELEWDGSVRGRPAAAGVYFLSIEAGVERWTSRVVRIGN